MIDFDVAAYAMLAVSVSASAVQIGRWILNADPRALISAGRFSVLAVTALTPVVLLWLVMSGRVTLAMMLAAFVLPVFVQGGLRWRALLDPLRLLRRTARDWTSDFTTETAAGRTAAREPIDPNVVRQAVIALSAYVQQAARDSNRSLPDMHLGIAANGSAGASELRRMPVEEALDILGLERTAGPRQISEAHRRLEDKLKPELGDAHYLTMKINEARDVLLEDAARGWTSGAAG
jgi:hypothetical protein